MIPSQQLQTWWRACRDTRHERVLLYEPLDSVGSKLPGTIQPLRDPQSDIWPHPREPTELVYLGLCPVYDFNNDFNS